MTDTDANKKIVTSFIARTVQSSAVRASPPTGAATFELHPAGGPIEAVVPVPREPNRGLGSDPELTSAPRPVVVGLQV